MEKELADALMPVMNALVVATASRYVTAIHGLKNDHARLYSATADADARTSVARAPTIVAQISAATMNTYMLLTAYISVNTTAALVVTESIVDINLCVVHDNECLEKSSVLAFFQVFKKAP